MKNLNMKEHVAQAKSPRILPRDNYTSRWENRRERWHRAAAGCIYSLEQLTGAVFLANSPAQGTGAPCLRVTAAEASVLQFRAEMTP